MVGAPRPPNLHHAVRLVDGERLAGSLVRRGLGRRSGGPQATPSTREPRPITAATGDWAAAIATNNELVKADVHDEVVLLRHNRPCNGDRGAHPATPNTAPRQEEEHR